MHTARRARQTLLEFSFVRTQELHCRGKAMLLLRHYNPIKPRSEQILLQCRHQLPSVCSQEKRCHIADIPW